MESIYQIRHVVVGRAATVQKSSELPVSLAHLHSCWNILSCCPIVLVDRHIRGVNALPVGYGVVHEQNQGLSLGCLHNLFKPASCACTRVVKIAYAPSNSSVSIRLLGKGHEREHEIAIRKVYVLVVCNLAMQCRIIHPFLPLLKGVLLVVVSIAGIYVCSWDGGLLLDYLAERLDFVRLSWRCSVTLHSNVPCAEDVL